MYNKSERIAIEHERKNAEQMKVLQQKFQYYDFCSRVDGYYQDTAWYILTHGTVEDLKAHFKSKDDYRVYERGLQGENVLHLALLINSEQTRAMAEYLIRMYGSNLVNAPYQTRENSDDKPGEYEGEVPLHICIVNKCVPLLRQSHQLLLLL
eukprot:1175595-Prorocentrum_minimum.AAC.3